ncbi:MAG: penicillin-binding protein 2 [Chloroflexi bacterium]|nr:penicillin-binding protein 2 [Chloroflexota bacterium]
MAAQGTLNQQEIFNRRLPIVVVLMIVASGLLLLRLISFQQLAPEVLTELSTDYNRTVRLAAARGIIYDRRGQRLAVNTLEYRIGVSPNLVANAQRTATQLASILNMDELRAYEAVTSDEPWVLLAPRVKAEVGQQIEQMKLDLQLPSVTIEKIPLRSYPQGTLAAHILGYVSGDLQGYYGVEGYYQEQLAGRAVNSVVSSIPFDQTDTQEPGRGSDIYLTIDRDLQYVVESELQLAVNETSATGGTIIVMNPRTGDILAMANYPSFDPNAYSNVTDQRAWNNPAISGQYEPGSVFKVLTVAAALDKGVITPQWTYNDQGQLNVGGVTIQNWDRGAHGAVDVTGVLVQSLNVGAATISTALGPTNFYSELAQFGMGRLTGVNLEGEAAGTMHVPGDTDWSESNLGTNSFGQGLAVTPLQMITAISAIANDGLMMQPNIVQKIVTNGQEVLSQRVPLGRPISAEVAHQVRDMMVAVVRDGLDDKALLPGYTLAGKTGTAEIPTPVGYRDDAWIMSFIGFLPADEPQVIILYKLDEPNGRWASEVVAPLFRRLAERLVILLEIPPDDVRQALKAQGGIVSGQ